MEYPAADSVVVGIDGSKCSEEALAWAIAEAKRSGRHLRLLHVGEWRSDIPVIPMPSAGVPDAPRSGRIMLDRAAAEAARTDVEATTHLIERSPPVVLAKHAQGAAMLVVGCNGRSPLADALLGSVSRGCLRNATCPVVVIPADYRAATLDLSKAAAAVGTAATSV